MEDSQVLGLLPYPRKPYDVVCRNSKRKRVIMNYVWENENALGVKF